MDAVGTLYLGKKLCLYLPVDDDDDTNNNNSTTATLTNRKLIAQAAQANVTQKYQFPDQNDKDDSNKFPPGSDQPTPLIWIMGMTIASTMKPTTTASTTMMRGSMMEVSFCVAMSTSSS